MSETSSTHSNGEKNIQREDFKSIMKLNKGYLYDKEVYENFDDELKVMQAFGYYEDGNNDTALEILHSTDDNLKNVLKYFFIDQARSGRE